MHNKPIHSGQVGGGWVLSVLSEEGRMQVWIVMENDISCLFVPLTAPHFECHPTRNGHIVHFHRFSPVFKDGTKDIAAAFLLVLVGKYVGAAASRVGCK